MKRTEAESTGLRIRQARARKGFTQKEFANRLGIQATWLSRLERNSGSPSDELLLKIAEETGTTFSWLTLQDFMPSSTMFRSLEEIETVCRECEDVIISDYTRELQVVATPNSSSFGNALREISLNNCPLSKWIIDLHLLSVVRANWQKNWRSCLSGFLSHILLSDEEHDTVKFTIVVPDDFLYNASPEELQVPIGNVSVLQLDMVKKQVVRERYFSTAPSRASRKYLEEELCFPDTTKPTTAE